MAKEFHLGLKSLALSQKYSSAHYKADKMLEEVF